MNQTNSDDGLPAVAILALNVTAENATGLLPIAMSVPLSSATNSTEQTVNATSVDVVEVSPVPSTIAPARINSAPDDAVNSQLGPLADGPNYTFAPDLTPLPSALSILAAGGSPLPEDPAQIRSLLVERYDATTPSGDRRFGCELGYICKDHERVQCSDLQLLHRMQGFGDIHAGLWCPYGADGYMNCPVGFFCPDPVTMTQCPQGMFCPHKTAVPAIQCRYCKVGAVALTAVPGGITVLGVLCTLILCFIVYRIIHKYREEQVDKWIALVERRMDSIRIDMSRLRKQEELDGIKPQLDIIAKRLADMKGGAAGVGGNTTFGISGGKTTFDVRRLFDEMDANCDGVLSFEELNYVFQLGEIQLREFIRRMNTLGGVDRGLTTVSRPLFCRHFIEALTQTSHFRPTMEEAATLFDSIATLAGTNKHGDIDSVTFFKTPYLGFLTDPQVNDLLTRLRKRQNEKMGGYGNSLIGSARSLGLDSTNHSRARARNAIQRESFIENYPRLLLQVVAAPVDLPAISERSVGTGVDITFKDLSLTVKVNQKATNVVDGVTGRLRRGTMTALMGGSGAGKSSLLNALCGRAFYGETRGDIFINGQTSSLEEHSHCIGFVPQDDIVYAELTVRENFVFSGRFQLPNGTKTEDIYDLADATLANLGLSRVANSIVGDVHRRGVSGGEKKRVSIGLELMANPRAIFLDEPTSGLDSSSALLVMQSLRALVENQGVTVCCVIHQPRKVIFELFDDLILLGAGGKVVYNGPVFEAQKYVEGLNYNFPEGDSVADWLIDVSTGQAKPVEGDENENATSMLDVSIVDPSFAHNVGVSSNDVEESHEQAKVRREQLYSAWDSHFYGDAVEDKARYNPPAPFALPEVVGKPSFLIQLAAQLQRSVLVMKRNYVSKLVDTMMIVGAVILVAAFEGVLEVTVEDRTPGVSFEALVSGSPEDLTDQLGFLFRFALGSTKHLREYALKSGLLAGVLIGLSAAKILTEKRTEFFREAASGYDVNAYFLAANITATIEHSLQTVLAAGASYWIRDSLASWWTYMTTYLMLSWLSVSWALLLPLLVTPKNVVVVIAFFMAFFGLLTSGGITPVLYSDIYEEGNSGLALFSGFVAPTRYFIEGLTVSELRCLPAQSGFTVVPENSPILTDSYSFAAAGLAQNDLNVGDHSCSGWYWGVLPSFLVGLTVRLLASGIIHASGRSMQAKRSLQEVLRYELENNVLKSTWLRLAIFLAVFVTMFGVSAWAILRKVGE